MSRTDNTDPHWVRAAWWEPCHWSCQHAAFSRGRECDLPPEPVVDRNHSKRFLIRGHCIWIPSWDGLTTGGGYSAPSWFCRAEFTAPERRRIRDQLVRARQEHRATGEVDVVVEAAQHRHRANWDWW